MVGTRVEFDAVSIGVEKERSAESESDDSSHEGKIVHLLVHVSLDLSQLTLLCFLSLPPM
jgi:hypothetical protein